MRLPRKLKKGCRTLNGNPRTKWQRKGRLHIAKVLNDIAQTACFGDVEFLNLEEMQIIIDHLDRWVEKYGTNEKVGEAVLEWLQWCLENAYDAEKDEWREHPHINLWSWLKGLRPEQLKE